jgi:hypothetical protein
MYTKFWSVNLKFIDNLRCLGVVGRIIFTL